MIALTDHRVLSLKEGRAPRAKAQKASPGVLLGEGGAPNPTRSLSGKPLGKVISWMGCSDPWGKPLEQKIAVLHFHFSPLTWSSGLVIPRRFSSLDLPGREKENLQRSSRSPKGGPSSMKTTMKNQERSPRQENIESSAGCDNPLHGLRSILRELRWTGS